MELTGIKFPEEAKLYLVEALNDINIRTAANTKKKVISVKKGVTGYYLDKNLNSIISVKEKTTKYQSTNKQIVTATVTITPASGWITTLNRSFFSLQKNGADLFQLDLAVTQSTFNTNLTNAMADYSEFSNVAVNIDGSDSVLTFDYEDVGILYEGSIFQLHGTAAFTVANSYATAEETVTKYVYRPSARFAGKGEAAIDTYETS